MKKNLSMLTLFFWLGLIAFFAWDWAVSTPINTRLEPPLIAAGSGRAPVGGHCAATF